MLFCLEFVSGDFALVPLSLLLPFHSPFHSPSPSLSPSLSLSTPLPFLTLPFLIFPFTHTFLPLPPFSIYLLENFYSSFSSLFPHLPFIFYYFQSLYLFIFCLFLIYAWITFLRSVKFLRPGKQEESEGNLRNQKKNLLPMEGEVLKGSGNGMEWKSRAPPPCHSPSLQSLPSCHSPSLSPPFHSPSY